MTQIANNYAQALYGLAKEEDLTRLFLDELLALDAGISEEPAFLRLLSAPNLSKDTRCDILDESFRGKVHPYILNFLKILTEKGYIRHFSDCCRAYKEQYNEDNNILSVYAVSAIALTDDQKTRLTDKLSAITGKHISLTNRVDPQCLGGIRLDYNGKRVDGTVQNRLHNIQKQLKNTVL